jgi:hypothetical protein
MPKGYKHKSLKLVKPNAPALESRLDRQPPEQICSGSSRWCIQAGWRCQFVVKRHCAGANIPVKKCPYCGAEHPDDAVMCVIDHTPFERPTEPTPPPEPTQAKRPESAFAPLSEADQRKDLVTLVSCRTLPEADMVVSRLQAAGINAFLPDESLMQVIGWNLNTYGYVRVQIAPKDYDAARNLLGGN